MEISIKAEIARHNYKYKYVANNVGIPESTFYKKLRKNNFSIGETQKILSFIGAKLVMAS
ncbi:hypothetical protein [Propionispora hippei]|jgi:predicted transcriptional regulator|uniref:XRE family transcriptional regulator n=1 Tax=Propionispora hippei DSM 15287 TaxID=1123003 RepID=A0A1M6HR98_9FIRM|nr:hypothetical protein [Propionispora hippei]SHJ24614.1 hypothetical protein SAMN02745170_02070 [Propionispora hippei DSM 15287]